MKFFVAVAFAVIAAAVADVSHLGNTYLPPHHGSGSYSSNSYSQPDTSYLAPGGSQTYSSGAEHSTYGSGGHSHGSYNAPSVSYRSSAPARSYLAPAGGQTYSSHGAPSTYGSTYSHSYRSQGHSAPVSRTYLAPSSHNAYSGSSTASYTQSNYEAEPRYTHQTYNGPSSSGTQYASNGGYDYGKKH